MDAMSAAFGIAVVDPRGERDGREERGEKGEREYKQILHVVLCG